MTFREHHKEGCIMKKFFKEYFKCIKYTVQNVVDRGTWEVLGDGVLAFIYIVTIPLHPVTVIPFFAIRNILKYKKRGKK